MRPRGSAPREVWGAGEARGGGGQRDSCGRAELRFKCNRSTRSEILGTLESRPQDAAVPGAARPLGPGGFFRLPSSPLETVRLANSQVPRARNVPCWGLRARLGELESAQ